MIVWINLVRPVFFGVSKKLTANVARILRCFGNAVVNRMQTKKNRVESAFDVPAPDQESA
jgi:hypothetical protein